MSDEAGSPHIVQRSSYARVADAEEGLGIESLEEGAESKSESSETSYSHPSTLDRFLRRGKRKVGVKDSLKAIAFSSWLNVLIIVIPVAWVAHFATKHDTENQITWKSTPFFLNFIAIIPLVKLCDYGGEQMMFYLGPDLGDLLSITLNNTVEATLAFVLLNHCKLKLLQSTIMGVVLLRLLGIPGVAFAIGGARVLEQDLHPHLTQLNHTLLTIGVLTLLLPAAFFGALGGGVSSTASEAGLLVNDAARGNFLKMSRGLAFILLAVYVCSRVFLHKPPGHSNPELAQHELAPKELRDRALEFDRGDPEVSQWVCLAMLTITIGIMAATAEWLVDSVDFVEEFFTEEWFGLILLPLVSFSGDAFLAIVLFARTCFRSARGQSTPPTRLANARPIDLSIQFTLFWMPLIVILGWWTGRPMSLLFDMFEVALVVSSCFIVNYVTADSKTNYVEGFCLLAFYVMIALCSWFYTGQDEISDLLVCQSVVVATNSSAA